MSARWREDIDKAHQIQSQAAVLGVLRGTTVGLGLVTVAHYSWPTFRRQTLPFKAFLISTFAIGGLVFGAESALQTHEAEERRRSNLLRQEARYDLIRQGIIPTETELGKWTRPKT